jgi:hypothetical protein
MKLFSKLTSLLLIVSLIACKEDTPFNPLLGTWQYLYETYSNCDNATDEGRFDFPAIPQIALKSLTIRGVN